MSRRNLVDDSSGLGIVDLDVSSAIIFLNPTYDNEVWILYGRAGPLEIEPLWEAGSTRFRTRCTQTDDSPHHLENLHPHRLGSFKDFRLNLETFPRLQTLVVHIITDQKIRETNFRIMSDEEVFQFLEKYIWHARRHRHFRDNLNALYHMPLSSNLKRLYRMSFSADLDKIYPIQGKRRDFSLKVRMSDGEGPEYILADLDTWEVERGMGGQHLASRPESGSSSKHPDSSTLPWGETPLKIQAHLQHLRADNSRRTLQPVSNLISQTNQARHRCDLYGGRAQPALGNCRGNTLARAGPMRPPYDQHNL
jgi:hypothetical protein